MGIMDKLKFWKKDENLGLQNMDLGLNDNTALSSANTGLPGQEQPFSAQPQFGYPQQQQQPSYPSYPNQSYPQVQQPYPQQYQDPNTLIAKNLEIISSKLDTLKMAMDNLNQRLTAIEMMIKGDEYKRW